MITVEYGGRGWRFENPSPAVALALFRLGKVGQDEILREVFDLLTDYMVFDDWVEFDFGRYEGLPPDAPLELLYSWLEEAVGKPFSAVAALSVSLVENWGMVRGRLITSGIADPMGQIRSLGAMLDAVEFMIMEGFKDEKEREKYKRKVYRPRRKSGPIEKPSGFESSDMAAQSAMLEALEG